VLAQVGLEKATLRKAGRYSLGMRQRLGIAAALLGDPPIVMLDEPFNGMDPEGIIWMRGFLASLTAQGRAVLVSSHLMSEGSVPVSEVSAYRATPEEAYLGLTRDAAEFRAAAGKAR
jgi:ABC-2 type transport system ATP-binding protein